MTDASTIAESAAICSAAPLAADLAELRGLFMGVARRMAGMAEALAPEQEVETYAQNDHFVLGLTRIGRAIRQIGVLEEEVAGRRDPPTPQGRGAGGSGARAGDGAEPGDLNDLNDLNDLKDASDAYDPEDREVFAAGERSTLFDDFNAMRDYTTFEEFESKRRRNAAHEQAVLDAQAERFAKGRADAIARCGGDDLTEEEKQAVLAQHDADVRLIVKGLKPALEWEWRRRHEAIQRHLDGQRKAPRRSRRGAKPPGHGPPGQRPPGR
jgi:hypothetical protein